MKMQKTWATVIFSHGDSEVEASLNYQTKKFTLHVKHEEAVTFGKNGDTITDAINTAKCCMAALKYIKSELNL